LKKIARFKSSSKNTHKKGKNMKNINKKTLLEKIAIEVQGFLLFALLTSTALLIFSTFTYVVVK